MGGKEVGCRVQSYDRCSLCEDLQVGRNRTCEKAHRGKMRMVHLSRIHRDEVVGLGMKGRGLHGCSLKSHRGGGMVLERDCERTLRAVLRVDLMVSLGRSLDHLVDHGCRFEGRR